MKYIICLILGFLIHTKSLAQTHLPNSSIGITFLQLQPDNDSWYFRLAPIFNLGFSYEHKIGKASTISVGGMFKSGRNGIPCIDCPGASGKMNEWNIKIGAIRYFKLTDKMNLFSQLQFFYEKTNVPQGKYNFNVIGGEYNDWFRFINYTGLELSTGIEIRIIDSISFFLNPSLQFGNYSEADAVFEDRTFWRINGSILENVGVKYKF